MHRLAGETWGLLLAAAPLLAGPKEPREVGQDLLSALARSWWLESLERLALARCVAGLVAPVDADAALSGQIWGAGSVASGQWWCLPWPKEFEEGILCHSPFGTWRGASDGVRAEMIGEICLPSQHERLRWTAAAIAEAE